jgi:hypothetical protein
MKLRSSPSLRRGAPLALAMSAAWIAGCTSGAGVTGATGAASSSSSGGTTRCTNGTLDSGESDVDCGGPCPHCANDAACASADDCASGVCSGGRCAPCAAAADCENHEACVAGVCAGCVDNAGCVLGQVCVAGSCGPCASSADCDAPLLCVAGTCGACTLDSQCPANTFCIGGACGTCTLSSECPPGDVCAYGRCVGGFTVDMYQCPGMTSIGGGGGWSFYGCQGQITNTPTCNEIESPAKQDFDCTYVGKLPLVTDASAPPDGTSFVLEHQCPGVTSLGGGTWGFYGCQNQIVNTASCTEIEFPNTQDFSCSSVGNMILSTAAPAAPPGGTVVPMYQCPGVTSLGGGDWGFYGCQGQIASTPSCLEIESPAMESFPCTPVGSVVLEP